jgi:SAM-dependent methyltransferase
VTTLDRIMSWPVVYRLWIAPFAESKFAPIIAHNDISSVRSVLDVGCGPGTNASHFALSEYLGIDLNERYVEVARSKYGKRFVAVDAAEFVVSTDERFDFILVNSFLHHIDAPTAERILSNLGRLLTRDGHIHVLDLVMPTSASVARFLAKLDRGEFPRPLADWKQLFTLAFEPVVMEPYDVTMFGIPLWKMIYFKGRAR